MNRHIALISIVTYTTFISGCASMRNSDLAEDLGTPIIVQPMGEISLIKEGINDPSEDALLSDQNANKSLDSKTNSDVEIESFDEKNTPFSMSVAQKFFDGDQLVLNVHLLAKANINPKELAIEAVGLGNGEVIARDLRFLDSIVTSPTIQEGQKIAVTLRLDNAGLNEYQVRGMWGRDANSKRPISTSIEKPPSLRTTTSVKTIAAPKEEPSPDSELSLKILRTERRSTDCGRGSCPEVVTLYGLLSNNSKYALTDVSLAVGVFWQEGSQTPIVPKPGEAVTGNEHIVKLENEILAPGSKKRIRLFIDRELPTIPGGKFVPKARILGARSIEPS